MHIFDRVDVLKNNRALLNKDKVSKFGVTLGKKKLFFSKYKTRKLSKEEKKILNSKISKQNGKLVWHNIISIVLALFGLYILSVIFIKIFL